ncbi:glycoside hydrolase family 47 protein [Mycena vulgaris]|nr:glycoside hydrolase family 47 protein [Mycena vulgaris]
MRRRTIQYLVLLFIIAVATHLYFISPFHPEDPSLSADWSEDIEDSIPRRRLSADIPKRDAVVAAFQHAWSAYERDAMGSDEYHPMSHRGSNLSVTGGIGYTVVDAIDTMLLMGLTEEYSRASDWVRTSLRFDRDGRTRCFNTFETTIRVLGGLLSALHLSADQMYLRHAVDLADRMLPAFDTPSGLPLSSINLETRVGIPDPWNHQTISTAEATTLQLEFRDLAQLTKNATYWHKAEKVMSVVNAAKLPSNLAPISMKQFLTSPAPKDRTEPVYLKMYEDAMQGIHDHLVHKTPTRKLTYVAELIPHGADWRTSWTVQHKQDHLVCFLAGSLMLGATTAGARGPGASETGQRDWNTGVALLEGCMETHRTATGLSPEIVQFQPSPDQPGRDWHIKDSKCVSPSANDSDYQGSTFSFLFLDPADRRATTQSTCSGPRRSSRCSSRGVLTGDTRYRAYAWGIFEAIEQHARLPGGGYATVADVDTVPVRLEDKQETFYLSETLKYLFLTFADESVLPLDEYVFNTEAHPLPIFRPSIQPMFSL